MADASRNLVGLIGGTGLGHALAAELSGESIEVDTPFGPPSAPILRGRLNGVEIAFVPRHGAQHTLAPTIVPYRANIWAMKSLGVTHIVASGATGSLREEIRPRDLVIPDQVIDRTYRRAGTFFDAPGLVAHIEFAQPFCPMLRARLLTAATDVNVTTHDGGTYVCMEGPAFSTVAESRMHRSWGGDLIGMTALPEARLAREAEICYALVALPTDYDCWRPHDPTVSSQELLREILGHVEHATANSIALIKRMFASLSELPMAPCRCQRSLDLAIWTKPEHWSPSARESLKPLLARLLSERAG